MPTTNMVDLPLIPNFLKSPILKIEVNSTILKLKKGTKKIVKNPSTGELEEKSDSEISWNTSGIEESGSDPSSPRKSMSSSDFSSIETSDAPQTKKEKKKK